MEVCRSCLSTEKLSLVPLTEDFVKNYNMLTNLNVNLLDEYPQYSCQSCVESVSSFVDFREKCILTEKTLTAIKCQIPENDFNGHVNVKQETIVKEEYENKNDRITSLLKFENDFDNDIEPLSSGVYTSTLSDSYVDEDVKPKRSKRNLKIVKSKSKKHSKILKDIPLKKIKKEKDDGKKTTKCDLLCGLCSASFNDLDLLQSHLEKHKKDEKCSLCLKKCWNWPELFGHRIDHLAGKMGHCFICLKKCVTALSMEHHYLKEHFEGENKCLKCPYCTKFCATPRKLRNHVGYVHSQQKQYICDICSLALPSRQAFKIHIAKHSGVKKYQCEFCEYSTHYCGGLKAHKIRKHAVEKVTCPNCDRAFEDQEHMDKHSCQTILSICPVCGKQFNKIKLFTRHMMSHQDATPYQCQRCPAAFKSRTALGVHINKHDGNRTRECEFCHRRFYHHSALIKHRRVHTGERPYVCQICQKGFTGSHNLKVHMKVHGQNLIVKKNSLDNETVTTSNVNPHS